MTNRRKPWTRIAVATLGAALALASESTPSRANAPAGRYVKGTGTVFDTRTKLTWQQTASTNVTLLLAHESCAGLQATLGGTGWRLPTINELATLIDYVRGTPPLLDSDAFPSAPAGIYYSATPASFAPTTTVWVVNFTLGKTATTAMSNPQSARCVR